jgi:hypothetical protein
MPPGGDEHHRPDVPVTPRVPGGVHLVAEADDDRVAEVPHAVGVGPQIEVVLPGGDLGDERVGGVDLHERDRTVGVDPLRERSVERLRPAAVVADQVRLLPRHLGELRDGPVARLHPALVDAHVGGGAPGE